MFFNCNLLVTIIETIARRVMRVSDETARLADGNSSLTLG